MNWTPYFEGTAWTESASKIFGPDWSKILEEAVHNL